MYLHSECTQFASSCLMQFTFSCDSLNLLDKYRVTSLVMGSWGLRCQVWQEILCDLRSYFGQFLIWKATKWVCHFFTLRAICLKMCKNDACKMDIYPWVFYTHGPTNFYCLSVCMSARKLLKITSKQLWKHLRSVPAVFMNVDVWIGVTEFEECLDIFKNTKLMCSERCFCVWMWTEVGGEWFGSFLFSLTEWIYCYIECLLILCWLCLQWNQAAKASYFLVAFLHRSLALRIIQGHITSSHLLLYNMDWKACWRSKKPRHTLVCVPYMYK